MSPEALAKLMEGPAAKPPPGVIPNFDNPSNSNHKIRILCILAAAIGTPFVIMRLYTRIVLLRKIMFEDVCIVLGAILAGCGLNVVVMKTMPLHYGAHQWNIRYKDLITYLKLAHAATLLFNVIMLLLRLAIIVQIMRAFVAPRSRGFTFWASWTLIVANVCFWATITMLEVFSCSPREKLWNPVVEGKCIDRHAYQVASAVMNMGSEMLILLLPLRIIWTLSLTMKQRLGLTTLFSLGIITIASSTLRLAYTIKMWPTNDITYFISDGITLWTIPEITCSIIVPCITVLPQFIRIVKGKFKARRHSSTYITSGENASGGRRGNSKQSGAPNHEHYVIRKTTEFLISDIEYHELVMQPSIHSTHSEEADMAPWVQEPSQAHVSPGRPGHNGTMAGLSDTTVQRMPTKYQKPRLRQSHS